MFYKYVFVTVEGRVGTEEKYTSAFFDVRVVFRNNTLAIINKVGKVVYEVEIELIEKLVKTNHLTD